MISVCQECGKETPKYISRCNCGSYLLTRHRTDNEKKERSKAAKNKKFRNDRKKRHP